MSHDITVLSIWYNRASKVDASIASLAAQAPADFKAILVDDGSGDDTLAQLRKFASPTIEVRTQANSGFSRTLIGLCAEVESRYIALHGSADESLPGRLAAQKAFLDAHPDVVAVGCGIENVDEVSGRRWNVIPREELRAGPISGSFGISHGEVMFRRDAYLRSGGYRPAFVVGQASDLFRRMSRIGSFGYVRDVLYRRYLTADGVNAKADKIAQRSILAALSTSVHRHAVAAGSAQAQDDLDRYGLLLPYFGIPDRRIARALASAAITFWSAGDRSMARRIARRSLGERLSLSGFLTLAIVTFGVGPARAPALAIARRLSRGEGEAQFGRLG